MSITRVVKLRAFGNVLLGSAAGIAVCCQKLRDEDHIPSDVSASKAITGHLQSHDQRPTYDADRDIGLGIPDIAL